MWRFKWKLLKRKKENIPIVLEQDVALEQDGKKIILEKGDRIQIIEVLNESST